MFCAFVCLRVRARLRVSVASQNVPITHDVRKKCYHNSQHPHQDGWKPPSFTPLIQKLTHKKTIGNEQAYRTTASIPYNYNYKHTVQLHKHTRIHTSIPYNCKPSCLGLPSNTPDVPPYSSFCTYTQESALYLLLPLHTHRP